MNADLITPGHVSIIQEARSMGDVVIGLLTDSAIAGYKRLPYMPFEQRKLVMDGVELVGFSKGKFNRLLVLSRIRQVASVDQFLKVFLSF